MGGERITSRRGGGVLVARDGRRKLFRGERRERFLAMLAATCNVKASAEAAEVTQGCVYDHRARDPAFRARWELALDQGYARLEAELLRRAAGGEAPPATPGGEPVRAPRWDPELAKFLFREHGRRLTAKAARARDGAPTQPAAPWAEVERFFTAKLKAYHARTAKRGAGREG